VTFTERDDDVRYLAHRLAQLEAEVERQKRKLRDLEVDVEQLVRDR
jgi:hypothetical protein